MGTYITCKVKNTELIGLINGLWNKENKGYENIFHATTKNDMLKWLENIHSDPSLNHLRYIKTVKQLDKEFTLWGLGSFQFK